MFSTQFTGCFFRHLKAASLVLCMCGFSAQAVMSPNHGRDEGYFGGLGDEPYAAPDDHSLKPLPPRHSPYTYLPMPVEQVDPRFASIKSQAELQLALDQLAEQAFGQFEDPSIKQQLSDLYANQDPHSYSGGASFIDTPQEFAVAFYKIQFQEGSLAEQSPVVTLELADFLQKMPLWAKLYRLEALLKIGQDWEYLKASPSRTYLNDLKLSLPAQAIVFSGSAQSLILNDFVFQALLTELDQGRDWAKNQHFLTYELLTQLRFHAQMSGGGSCGSYLSQ